MSLMGREPVAITSAVRLVVYALIKFGVIEATEDQIIAGLAALEAVLFLVARQNVASPATLRQAGTSLHEVKAASRPEVAAQLHLTGPDAYAVQATDTGTRRDA